MPEFGAYRAEPLGRVSWLVSIVNGEDADRFVGPYTFYGTKRMVKRQIARRVKRWRSELKKAEGRRFHG